MLTSISAPAAPVPHFFIGTRFKHSQVRAPFPRAGKPDRRRAFGWPSGRRLPLGEVVGVVPEGELNFGAQRAIAQ